MMLYCLFWQLSVDIRSDQLENQNVDYTFGAIHLSHTSLRYLQLLQVIKELIGLP